MNFIDLKTYQRLRDNDDKLILTENDKKEKEILENSTLTITLEERQQLEEQAQEIDTETMKVIQELNGNDVEPILTENAKRAKEILENSTVIMTLEERKQLEEQAQEVETEAMKVIQALTGKDAEPILTKNAKKAKEILENSTITMTLEERRQLEEQAQEIDTEAMKVIQELNGNDVEPILTKNAKMAKETLENSTVTTTLEERKQLEEQAQEIDTEAMKVIQALTGKDAEPILTKNAKKAKEILENSTVTMTLEERHQLEEQAQEIDTEAMKVIQELSGNDVEPILTENAKRAKEILDSRIFLSESKIKTITPEQIGKISLDALKNTEEILSEQESQEKGMEEKDITQEIGE